MLSILRKTSFKNFIVICCIVLSVFTLQAKAVSYTDYSKIGNFSDVPEDKTFNVNFSKTLDKSSVINGGIQLVNADDNTNVPINFNFTKEKSVQVTPKEKLTPGKIYFLYVHNTIKDNKGKKLEQGSVSVIKVKNAEYIPQKPVPTNEEMKSFINDVLPGAVDGLSKYNVFPSVTLGQAILESAWGKSKLAQEANNLFGMKANMYWGGDVYECVSNEWINGQMTPVPAYWRKYAAKADSVKDHSKKLATEKPYVNQGVTNAKNYYDQISLIKKAGYATDPKYVEKVCSIIEKYELWKYDPNGQIIALSK